MKSRDFCRWACLGSGAECLRGRAAARPVGDGAAGARQELRGFQSDDAICRGYASQQTGGASAAQAANNSAVGSALLGTALGAGVGAALGSVGGAVGAGAAIGGATGLLAGSAIGAGNAQAAGGNVQARYDTAYTQCMYARGDTVQSPPGGMRRLRLPCRPGYTRMPTARATTAARRS